MGAHRLPSGPGARLPAPERLPVRRDLPARAVGTAIVMPRVSSEAMTLHLEEISKAVGKTAHAMLVCDGAGWHRPGGRLTVPENIALLRLPPYAPELNPMENVWEYLRETSSA